MPNSQGQDTQQERNGVLVGHHLRLGQILTGKEKRASRFFVDQDSFIFLILPLRIAIDPNLPGAYSLPESAIRQVLDARQIPRLRQGST
jgi:hypothetical protein